jgi:hypothetical protein
MLLEKKSFTAHVDLLAALRARRPPLLLHKGELVEAGATWVSPTERTAIRDIDRRVVAVVLNAVDDHLSRSAQLRLAWTVRQFQHLDALLYEARLANRAVIVTGDHGHVLEDGTRRLPGGEEEWMAIRSLPWRRIPVSSRSIDSCLTSSSSYHDLQTKAIATHRGLSLS